MMPTELTRIALDLLQVGNHPAWTLRGSIFPAQVGLGSRTSSRNFFKVMRALPRRKKVMISNIRFPWASMKRSEDCKRALHTLGGRHAKPATEKGKAAKDGRVSVTFVRARAGSTS